MALSMLNYFVWQKEDARIPFIIADCVVIGVLHYVEKLMQAARLAREQAVKHADSKKHEDDKKTGIALKQAQREEQKRVQQRIKKAPPGSTAHMNQQLNLPDKTK